MVDGYIEAGPSGRGWSRLGTILTCPQSYAWRYVRHAPSPPSDGQATGSVGHAALAHHYGRIGAGQPGGVLLADERCADPSRVLSPWDAIERCAEDQRRAGASPNVAAIRDTFNRYLDVYSQENYRVIAIEAMFRASIPCAPHVVPVWQYSDDPHAPPVQIGERTVTEYEYTARADLVYQFGGKVYIVDHKFHARVDKNTAGGYSLSGQFVGLRWLGSQVYGDDFGGLVLNIVQTTPPHNMVRPPLKPAPHLLATFARTVVDAEARREAIEAEGRAPNAWPKVMSETVCYNKYSACPHVDRCLWGA